LVDALGIIQISTGDLLRAARRAGTELGREAQSFMDAGLLVPDSVVIALVAERLSRPDANEGYILDGFPRNTAQADAVSAAGISVERVVSIVVPTEQLTGRLAGRRVCGGCGATYNAVTAPSAVDGVCDRCGGETAQRRDDSAEVVSSRLKVYSEETQPLVEYYEARGVLRTVDGLGTADAVYSAIMAALQS